MPSIVGLTGGIATGKSTVSKIWIEAGVTVIDADRVAREVVRPGRPAHRLIRGYFGPTILHPDGTLNRAALGRLVFSDAKKRVALNRRIHPFIITSMITQVFVAAVLRWRRVIVLDAPLLFESGTLVPFCSRVVVVAAPRDVQLARLLSRDKSGDLTKEDANNRINSQMPLSRKIERADFVIDNAGSLDSLQTQALDVLEKVQPSTASEYGFRAVVCALTSSLAFLFVRFLQHG